MSTRKEVIINFKDNMLVGYHHAHFIFFLFQQFGYFRKGFARNNEAAFLIGDEWFLTQCEAVTVYGNQSDILLLNIKERTGMHWFGVGGGDCEQSLINH